MDKYSLNFEVVSGSLLDNFKYQCDLLMKNGNKVTGFYLQYEKQ